MTTKAQTTTKQTNKTKANSIATLKKQLEALMKENERLRSERSRSVFRSDSAFSESLKRKGYPDEIIEQLVSHRQAYLLANRYALISFKPYK